MNALSKLREFDIEWQVPNICFPLGRHRSLLLPRMVWARARHYPQPDCLGRKLNHLSNVQLAEGVCFVRGSGSWRDVH